jgi:hypothetical protein
MKDLTAIVRAVAEIRARRQAPDFAVAMAALQKWCDERSYPINVRQQARCYVFADRLLYAELLHGERMLFDGSAWHVAERIKF